MCDGGGELHQAFASSAARKQVGKEWFCKSCRVLPRQEWDSDSYIRKGPGHANFLSLAPVNAVISRPCSTKGNPGPGYKFKRGHLQVTRDSKAT